MRRCHDPITVRLGEPVGVSGCAVSEFIWRQRLWKVRGVEAAWVESAPWWLGPQVRAVRGDHATNPGSRDEAGSAGGDDDDDDLLGEQQVWRVQAGNGVSEGVFELALTARDATWMLRSVVD